MDPVTALVSQATHYLQILSAAIATLFLVVGGIEHMTARSPVALERARLTMTNALYGYAVALLAHFLVGLVARFAGNG